jgi:hypothetical protein
MFTQKHYKAFVEILLESTVDYLMVDLLCEFFKKDNPKFDDIKFKKACGYKFGWDRPPDWDAIDAYIRGDSHTMFLCVGG